MPQLVFLLPALPFLGYVLLALFGRRMSRTAAACVGVGSVALSFAVTAWIVAAWLLSPPAAGEYTQVLWRWIDVDGFQSDFALFLDPLALIMCLVVTGVGALIHLYATEYMEGDAGFSRFFAYMNLFVGSMLMLVLADDLLLLYLGWEGVGLCSYLLIGFWYRDPANGRAARKAFVVTRVGDVAMAIALFLIFRSLGTLHIGDVLRGAEAQWAQNSALAIAVAALLLGGAVGKSAQLPLQVWLPDAMAGPTPVSALIHAATMVTAGVYLIARLHTVFELAPPVMHVIAVVGAATLILSAFTALTQRDLKRVLAYSTISQIGYMFLGLGVGAWSAAVLHLMTHAFFKALLFLCAGSVLMATHHQGDLFALGGLRRKLPVTFWTFVIGGAALAGFPIVTAGFYSKDEILWQVWGSQWGGVWLWIVGFVGVLLTSTYIFRLIFLAFLGEPGAHVEREPGLRVKIPLIVLAVLSIAGGWVELPPTLGSHPWFSSFLAGSVPVAAPESHPAHGEALLEVVAALDALVGIGFAWLVYRRGGWGTAAAPRTPLVPAAVQRYWFSGWGFDALYHFLFVRPFLWFARTNAADVVDRIPVALAWLARLGNRALIATQNGRVRTYVAGVALGAVVLLAVGVLL
jgi:NADH-quinone oxidoreductase subunit L